MYSECLISEKRLKKRKYKRTGSCSNTIKIKIKIKVGRVATKHGCNILTPKTVCGRNISRKNKYMCAYICFLYIYFFFLFSATNEYDPSVNKPVAGLAADSPARRQ